MGSAARVNTAGGCLPLPKTPHCCLPPLSTSQRADQYQPYYGKTTGDCLTCDASAVPRLTSDPGSDYCTVPYVDLVCTDGAWVYERLAAWAGGRPAAVASAAAPTNKPCHLTSPLHCSLGAAGYEYNADTGTCTICAAGMQRMVGREDACVPW